jgi:hypothetical protein
MEKVVLQKQALDIVHAVGIRDTAKNVKGESMLKIWEENQACVTNYRIHKGRHEAPRIEVDDERLNACKKT